EVLSLPGHAGGVVALAWAPDGKTLVSSGADRTLRVWDVKAGKELPKQENQQVNFENLLNPSPRLQVTPGGKRLLVWIPLSVRKTTLAAYDLAGGKELQSFDDTGRHVTAVVFSSDGRRALTGARDGSVRVYDMEAKEVLPGGDWFLFERGVG